MNLRGVLGKIIDFCPLKYLRIIYPTGQTGAVAYSFSFEKNPTNPLPFTNKLFA